MATILYADVLEHTPLPIDAQDIVTRVRLVIAGTRAGREPDWMASIRFPDASYATGLSLPLMEAPFVHEKVDALDSAYHATRSFALPDGVNPFHDPTDTEVGEPDTATGVTNSGSPSAIRDGDGSTYAQNTGSDSVYISYNGDVNHVIYQGFKIRYSATFAADAPNRDTQGLASVGIDHYGLFTWPEYVTYSFYELPSATDPIEIYAVFPYDARGLAENYPGGGSGTPYGTRISVSFNGGAFAAAGDLKIYEFYPLRMNTDFLDGIAAQNMRLPASAPQRVTVNGYVAPDKAHTITGWPGGDYTGSVAKHTYGGGVTVIDFEQKGAPPGASQESAQVASYNASSSNVRIQSATYPVRLGQRQ